MNVVSAGSDPKLGVVYVATDTHWTRLTLTEAREFVADLLWHMERAARGDEPADGWPEDRATEKERSDG